MEKSLHPAFHVQKPASRRGRLFYPASEGERVKSLRKATAQPPPIEAMEQLIGNLQATKSNAELLLAGLR